MKRTLYNEVLAATGEVDVARVKAFCAGKPHQIPNFLPKASKMEEGELTLTRKWVKKYVPLSKICTNQDFLLTRCLVGVAENWKTVRPLYVHSACTTGRYCVVDGNHRVAVMLLSGWTGKIPANVLLYGEPKLAQKLFVAPTQEDLNKRRHKDWKKNPDGSFDVRGDVNITPDDVLRGHLRYRFRKVSGDFHCDGNGLTSLVGCPQTVGRDFWCDVNHLTSLVGGPQEWANLVRFLP
jgi:hypothetical protein